MSDESEEETDEAEEIGPASIFNLFRKAMFAVAIIFIGWTYATKNLINPHAAHTPANTQKSEHNVAKNVAKEEHKAVAAATPETPPAQETTPAPAAAPVAETASPPVAEVTHSEAPAPAAVDNRDEEIKLLKERLDQMDAKIAAPVAPVADTAEKAADKEHVTHLEEQLQEQEKSLQELKGEKDHVAKLEEQLQAQDKSLQELKDQIGSVTAKSNRELSALTAFAILKDTIHNGEPFTVQLNQLSKLVPDNAKNSDDIVKILDEIKPYAEKGLPTWPVLQQQFSELLPVALTPESKDGSWQKNLRSLIRIRKVGEQQKGDDDQSILARAEAKIARHDISAALKEVDTLSKPAADVLAPWTDNAKAFVNTSSAIDALQLALSADPNA